MSSQSRALAVCLLGAGSLCACGQAERRQASDASGGSSVGGSLQGATSQGGATATGGSISVSSGGTPSVGVAGTAGATSATTLRCGTPLEDDAPGPSQGDAIALVGTYNGQPFSLDQSQVHADFQCGSGLHLNFALEAEGISFVVKDCTAFANLPDGFGLALLTDGEVLEQISNGPEPYASFWVQADGHLRLHADETTTNPAVDVEVKFSLPNVGPFYAPCPG